MHTASGRFALQNPGVGGNQPGARTIPLEGTVMPNLNDMSANCTAMKANGSFCDRPSAPGAPFPICIRHASAVVEFVNQLIPSEVSAPLRLTVAAIDQCTATPKQLRQRKERDEVVYYLRIGESVKIGTTGDLAARLRSYPPQTVVLATEPGGRDVETRRITQFATDRIAGREWFEPSPKLMAHIRKLASVAA